jgi:ectoine hydroxylase-related dioxygenase (phytanoyl-CoA dioxygenase family)
LVIENLLTVDEINYYSDIYNSFLNNSINSEGFRSDLSGSGDASVEKITQIMVPSRLYPELMDKPLHRKTLQIARELLGGDMDLDFDMLINKAPHTSAETPWHQDAAYWINMPDMRAVSCWVAIDRALLDNGCMWYTPKSHKGEILRHTQIGSKGALKCHGSEQGSVFVELEPGSCVLHHGRTLHYSRGNSTDLNRRAFITNFRPSSMIAFEREHGYDHTGTRAVKS